MSNEKPTAKDLLDQLAVAALTKSESDLREELREAGADPQERIDRLRHMITDTVDIYRKSQIDDLPDSVPDSVSDMKALLEQLMNFPGIAQGEIVGAFREKKNLTDNDLKVLTENLLRLVKRRGE